jgi:hypothetical protein
MNGLNPEVVNVAALKINKRTTRMENPISRIRKKIYLLIKSIAVF